jgi:pSer/pThr/pTyr-binding forkhead associated (FHA) protein
VPGGYGAPPPPPPGGGYQQQHQQQQQQQPMGAPPPPPGPSGMMGGGLKRLVLYYRGQRHEVNKDRFIIGRGKQSSDLTIKDPNVSRQHAMIENLNGQYFMVDMGSTNGIEFNGQRLQRKPVASGDVFNICDHELRFVLE